MDPLWKRYVFVVDTDSYAGNFERHMCAHVTGQSGDCGVGDQLAQKAQEEVPELVEALEDIVQQVPDDHGVHRPCSIYATPGWFNTGMGGEFKEGCEQEALEHYVRAVEEYQEDVIERTRLADHPSWTKEAKAREIGRAQRTIDKARARTTVQKYPAYLSVGIYLSEQPDGKILDAMKCRAREFAQNGASYGLAKKQINITGFRLVTETLEQDWIAL